MRSYYYAIIAFHFAVKSLVKSVVKYSGVLLKYCTSGKQINVFCILNEGLGI